MGLARDQPLGRTSSRAARVPALSSASRPPLSSRASVASTPAPPLLVRMANRSPRGGRVRARVVTASNSSCRLCTRSRPARRKAASWTASVPAIAPVCDKTARAPAGVWPALTRMTGLSRAAARAAERNLRAGPRLSMNSRMAPTPPSRARWSSRSPKSRSTMSPRETRWEKPIPRARAQSSTVATRVPDWATKASRPGRGRRWPRLALSP